MKAIGKSCTLLFPRFNSFDTWSSLVVRLLPADGAVRSSFTKPLEHSENPCVLQMHWFYWMLNTRLKQSTCTTSSEKKNAIFSINISTLCFLFESQKAEKALLYGCNCGMLVTTVYKGWRCAGERVRYLDSDNFTCEKKRWQTPTFTRKVLSAETALQLRTTGQRWDFSTLTPSSYNCIWF